MDLRYSPEQQQFAQDVREFTRANLDPKVARKVLEGARLERDDFLNWHKALHKKGWVGVGWPKAFGGTGWDSTHQHIFDEVTADEGAPQLIPFGLRMVAPVIMNFGNKEQQDYHLPKILSGENWWCQGYSEPGSGSDLASLKCKAERVGDHYIVNGQKTWTTLGQHADWIFCLVRTSTDGRQQEGISFLLIDMKTPGITVRPIVGIHGWVVFNEVLFDEVRVPADNLVGQENAGWTVAKALLEFERLKLARIGENKRRMKRARQLGDTQMDRGRLLKEQPWFRERFAQLQARLIALEANAGRFVERQKRGEPLGAEVGMLKLRGSRLVQAWEDLIVDALGMDASPLDVEFLQARTAPDGDFGLNQAIAATASSRRFLSRGYTIAGGSSEIQHNILAKQALGL